MRAEGSNKIFMYVMPEAISDLALPPLNGEIGGKGVKVRVTFGTIGVIGEGGKILLQFS